MSDKQSMQFQTEVNQLLHLMIHSLYSNKEIFLRELISNASDACDKLRFEAIKHPALWEGDTELTVRIALNKEERTLTLIDNGIGMSRDEVIHNIGTIAHSGTKSFLNQLTGDEARDAALIGQFGVGFYSAFIVADRVTLTTRRAGAPLEEAVRWESQGDGSFTLETVTQAERGTTIVLHLKEEENQFLEPWEIKNLVRRYSDHIQLPIVMKTAEEDETLNQANALWARSRQEITDEEYKEFYKHVSHDFEEPMAWTHAKVEGKQEYTQLLYIPSHPPFDLFDREQRHGIKLYVRRVFIMEDAEKLLPHYLRFVRGVIDSADLPLNVSREILQESKDIDAIRLGSTKKILSLLEDIAKDSTERYQKFWNSFGQVFKEGAAEEHANRDKWAKLLRFSSTHLDDAQQSVSLSDYLSRMKPEQKAIYYVTADSWTAAKNSPHLEIFKRHGIEVLLLSDRVDEWVVSHLHEFEAKPLHSVAKGDLDLSALGVDSPTIETQENEKLKPLIDAITEALGERVKEVRISQRLTESPACLVMEEGAISGHLERLLKAAGQEVPQSKPILEINPDHRLITRLQLETDNEKIKEWSLLLLEQSLIAEGGVLEDPAGFVRRINQLIV
ncbi:chaperone protein HtpG [Ferrovum sp. JA12]|uniref:molecular chaperone HtpG n=1 Tax=Ferrovum sp. JA12 TaxID=1356299 RepID=UPI0007037F72|nr:molecular chaperone HtpG [Ferrovum sp. JA12]KRH79705.1 chaperone protein HtpG [Ferrovum sp. JA12]